MPHFFENGSIPYKLNFSEKNPGCIILYRDALLIIKLEKTLKGSYIVFMAVKTFAADLTTDFPYCFTFDSSISRKSPGKLPNTSIFYS